MTYEFIIDASRTDKDKVCEDIKKKIAAAKLSDTRIYFAKSRADAERHVRMAVFLMPKEEICFVACGDLTGQVAAGLVGNTDNKCMAILDYNITEDLLKSFPERDFKDFDKMLNGEEFFSDMFKIGDDYAINVCTGGLCGMMAKVSREHANIGLADEKATRRALIETIFSSRYNRVSVKADGKPLNGKYLLALFVSNGQWCGSKYHSAPDAIMNDGLLDVGLIKCMPLFLLKKMFAIFEKGNFCDTAIGRRYSVICRAKHIELDSDRLIFISFDGEITASRHIDINVLPKAVKLILPRI